MATASRVVALCTGVGPRSRSMFLMGAAPEPVQLPYLVFLILTPNAVVLVDTGVAPPETTLPHCQPYTQTEDQRLTSALQRYGLEPKDVQVVIQTHLHWDHCCNNALFPHARFLVQREELRYAAAPLPLHARSFQAFVAGVPAYTGTRFEVLEGDERIEDGIRVLLTPGHTPGLQAVVVELGGHGCVLAGDNIPFFENLAGGDPRRFVPSSIHVNLEDYYRSVRRVAALGLPLVPGHEPALLGREDLLGQVGPRAR